jgi:hypothetical protein
MGRKSREKWERREGRAGRQQATGTEGMTEQERLSRIGDIERELTRLSDGEFESVQSSNCPLEDRHQYLEDVLAFESVGSGLSLFEGLEANGLKLPPPEQLNERQALTKLRKIVHALTKIGVFLIGFEDLSPQEFYSVLFHQTLWEGCYLKRRHPGSITFMDVSHRMSRWDLANFMKNLQKEMTVN